jgi:hypothetical protein
MIFLPIMTQHTRHIKPEHLSGPQPLHMQPVESELDPNVDHEPESTEDDTERHWKEALIRTEMRHRRAGRGPSRPESGI